MHPGVVRAVGKQQDIPQVPGGDVGVKTAGLNKVAGLDLGVNHVAEVVALFVHHQQRGGDENERDDGNQKGDPEP